MKEEILTTIDDLVGSFIYYDRKEDEDLPVGAIEGSLKEGVVTIEDIVARFKTALEKSL